MTVTLHLGDCLDVMRSMPDACVDAVVCDPPYGLSFMGKGWDHGVPGVEFWIEALRVAKPGAHILAFGGTRTYHRLACAIEDAGWEIRDCLVYLYGQGFPKGINVSRDARFCSCSAVPSGHATDGEVRRLRAAVPGVPEDASPGEGADVLQAVQRQAPGSGVGEARAQGPRGMDRCEPCELPREDDGRAESRVEGRGDVLQDARPVSGREVRARAGLGAPDGASGRLRDGASAGDGDAPRAAVDAGGSGSPSKPQAGRQPKSKPRIVAQQRHTQDGGAWPACDRCRKPMVPAGLNTALKPGHEPVVMARKPIVGTVAANVERFGPGALNIEECRLATHEDLNGGAYTEGRKARAMQPGGARRNCQPSGPFAQPSGRWPANVMLDEAAAVVLDEQSGTLTSGGGDKSSFIGYRGGANGGGPRVTERDSGGASRFFYCAKASRSEREAGCEVLPVRDLARGNAAQSAVDRGESIEREHVTSGLGATYRVRNHHPTVKPVDLMCWLVRLVTPPGGVALDPFMGSGTTGIACVREGRSFIGIEREPEYHAIAEARIAHARGETRPDAEQPGLDFGVSA